MSYNLTALAIESDLKPNDRLVFIALAHCANDATSYCNKTKTWRAWPSIDRIIRYTGLSASTVRRALKSLSATGVVRVSSRPQSHHRNLSNVYTLFHPGKPANDSAQCIPEEIAPAEIRPVPESKNLNEQQGVRLEPSPSEVGVTGVREGVTVTSKQVNKTNNKNNLLTREETFDPKLPPSFVMPDVWNDYIEMLIRRGRPLPDRQQHLAQGEFLGKFDPINQRKIIQQSLRNGWISLHPVTNIRSLKASGSASGRASRDIPLWEQLTDTSWAEGMFEKDLNVVASV